MLIYLGLFMVGSLRNYNIWIDNAKTNKVLVDGLLQKIKTHSEVNSFIILNFPAKIHQTATFIDGFESLIALKTEDKKRILRPLNVVHENSLKPTDINILNKNFILNACEESSYFLLGSNQQRLGLKTSSPGDIIKMDVGTVTIQKVNEKGKPTRVSLILNDSTKNDNICYLYFDENRNAYRVFNDF